MVKNIQISVCRVVKTTQPGNYYHVIARTLRVTEGDVARS